MRVSMFHVESSNSRERKNKPQNRGTSLNAAIAVDQDPIANK